MEEVKSRRHTMTDAEAETHCDALQVYDNGAWHPVVAFLTAIWARRLTTPWPA